MHEHGGGAQTSDSFIAWSFTQPEKNEEDSRGILTARICARPQCGPDDIWWGVDGSLTFENVSYEHVLFPIDGNTYWRVASNFGTNVQQRFVTQQ